MSLFLKLPVYFLNIKLKISKNLEYNYIIGTFKHILANTQMPTGNFKDLLLTRIFT